MKHALLAAVLLAPGAAWAADGSGYTSAILYTLTLRATAGGPRASLENPKYFTLDGKTVMVELPPCPAGFPDAHWQPMANPPPEYSAFVFKLNVEGAGITAWVWADEHNPTPVKTGETSTWECKP